MKVYFISGIGADKRLFSYIELPPAFDPEYIEWIFDSNLPGCAVNHQ